MTVSRRGTTVPGIVVLATAALVAGCAGSSSGNPTSAAPGSTGSTGSTGSAGSTGAATTKPPSATPSSSAPQPAATEVNPPGDIPDDQVFVKYRAPGAPFTVKVPEGWARSSAGGAVTFTDKLNSITIQPPRKAGRPSVASVRSGELPGVQRQGGNYHPRNVSLIHRKAGAVVLATYLQDSRPDPVTSKVVRDAVERYSFWHNGTEAVLTLSGPKGADNVDPWRIVSDSLTWR